MGALPAHLVQSLSHVAATPACLTCRLAALLDGCEPPENMQRCFANNYDIEARKKMGAAALSDCSELFGCRAAVTFSRPGESFLRATGCQ